MLLMIFGLMKNVQEAIGVLEQLSQLGYRVFIAFVSEKTAD